LDQIVEAYVTESLQTFLLGCHLASAVMLGVASERCIDLLTESYLGAIADAEHQRSFQRRLKRAGRSIKRRFDALRSELIGPSLPTDLRDALDIQLSGVFTLIRYTRNEAGHPTTQEVDRLEAHGNLLLFPQYCKRVYDLIEHLDTTPV